MACGCCKKKRAIKKGSENKNIQQDRISVLAARNLGEIKNPADRARKIAILKRKGKLI